MIDKILLFVFWIFIWLLLSWPPEFKQCVVGALVSVFVTFMTVDAFKPAKAGRRAKGPGALGLCKKMFWFMCYAAVFLWECLKANIDVAWRVACPTMPIRPATIRVRTELESDIGLTFLANSITLTPGRTTVDIDKDKGYIYIHLLFLKEGAAPDMHIAVVAKYERILKRIFE